MKNLLLIIIAVAVFTGCTKKSNNPTTDKLIIGKWFYTTDTARIYTNGTLTETKVFNESYSPYIQFNADGTGTIMNDHSGTIATLQFTYTISNKIITFSYSAQTVNSISYPANTHTATIMQLQASPKTLEIVFDESHSNGADTERDFEVVYLF